jgi:hypothetical protein
MYQWLHESGEVITTESIKEFAERYAINHSLARHLACGTKTRHHAWCSMSKRARRQRLRFSTVLVHKPTGRRALLGRSVKHFSRTHGLSFQMLSRVLNGGGTLAHRGWMLETTWQAATGNLREELIKK